MKEYDLKSYRKTHYTQKFVDNQGYEIITKIQEIIYNLKKQ